MKDQSLLLSIGGEDRGAAYSITQRIAHDDVKAGGGSSLKNDASPGLRRIWKSRRRTPHRAKGDQKRADYTSQQAAGPRFPIPHFYVNHSRIGGGKGCFSSALVNAARLIKSIAS
jgi:hypothetical protein